MPSSDPKTEIRRERFRAYCRRRGWLDEGRNKWAVTDIATATLKPRNKVSDLLNGSGSFGAKIARELEITLGLPEYYLEAVELPGEDQEAAVTPGKSKLPSHADDVERYVEDILGVLDTYLQSIDEDGREFVALALAKFAKNPKGERERVVGILASAMRGTPQPIDPTPTRSTRKTKASTKAGKPRLEVRAGGGQQTMFNVPVPPLRQIMRDENASKREREWYESLPKPPKVRS